MSAHFRTVHSRRSDHYSAKGEWSKRLRAAREKSQSRRVLNQYAPTWNVVGIGVGEKVSAGRATGVPAIRFLVQKKVPKRTLETRDLLIPHEIAGIPSDVEEVGRIRFMQGTSPIDPTGVVNPVSPGCSVGFRRDGSRVNAGTLGALVQDKTGAQFFLSNFHVFADLSDGESLFEITQPGIYDDQSARLIGYLEKGERPMVNQTNRIDAALARIAPNIATSTEILGVGRIEGTMRARVDIIVEKFGRSTLLQAGRIISTLSDIFVEAPGGEAFFVDQIAIRGLHGEAFGDEGDSGSLVVERASNKAIGLLFAHSDNLSFANHLSEVFSAFEVVLAE